MGGAPRSGERLKLRGWLELAGGVALLLCAGAAWEQANKVRDEALRADKVEALADTTRRLLVHAAGDRAVWQRRAVQQGQRADAFDAELGLTRKAFVSASVTITQLEALLWSQPVAQDTDGTRRAAFHVRQPPYTAEAAVALPPPPTPGNLQLRIALDTLPLDLRLECGEAEGGGVHQASAVLSGPPWATVRLGRVEQAPEICSPRPPLLNFGRYVSGLEFGAGIGVVITVVAHFVLHLF